MKKKIILYFLIFTNILLSQNYPNKSINLIVPWDVGGGTDIIARKFAKSFEKYIGQNVIVLNKGGASGSIGTSFVEKEKADGYNILFSADTPATFQTMGVSDLSYTNFDCITMLLHSTRLIVVSSKSPYKSIDDLVNAIRKNPNKVKMSYTAAGASGHIQGLIFKDLGLHTTMVSYGGGSAPILAVLSSQVDFTFADNTAVEGLIKSGNLRVLSVFSDSRAKKYPSVKTFVEYMPEAKKYFPLYFPVSILVKKGTDENAKKKILEASKKAIADKEFIDFVNNNSFETLYNYELTTGDKYLESLTSTMSYLLYDYKVAKKNPADFGIIRKNK